MSINGLIFFNSSLRGSDHYTPSSLPVAGSFPFVAPFWADVDTTRNGTIWRRETKNSTVLNRAREDIQTAFETPVGFQPQFAFVATWNRVSFFGSNDDTDQVSIVHKLLLSYSCMIV